MTPRRPTPIKSDLSTGPAAVIAPPQETTPTSRATRASKAVNAGNAGNASDTNERIVKVTACRHCWPVSRGIHRRRTRGGTCLIRGVDRRGNDSRTRSGRKEAGAQV